MNRIIQATLGGLTLLAAAAAAAPAAAQDRANDPSGAATIVIPQTDLPFSPVASPEAAALLARTMRDAKAHPAPPPSDIVASRAFYQRYNDDRLAEVNRRYRTRVERTTMGGVPVQVVTPADGIDRAKSDRVLINLHGGAFLWGAGSGALVEAAPIAAVAHTKVVTVDYRLAPEHRYPAGSQDVAAVYRELLKTYRRDKIGIYGCSAGGVLTAQSVAWFLTHDLPTPGAIGTFCGSGVPFGGDSAIWGQIATGGSPMKGPPLPYLAAVPTTDPVAYPGIDPAMLRRFPPTLLIAGGRDFAASAVTLMHRRLLAAGVDAQLVIVDGLWHAFFVYPDLPESQETYRIIADFFDRHLAAPARPGRPR